METSKPDLMQTTDGKIWASEFCKIFTQLYGDKLVVDQKFEDWIYTWMCSSIMCGSEQNKKFTYILKSHAGSIIQVYNYEPTPSELDKKYSEYLGIECTSGVASWNCGLYRFSEVAGLEHWTSEKSNATDSYYTWEKDE